jgi:bacillithiol biosynthesis deacetylase BshB1
MSVDILAFGAHADDVEIGAGGSLYKHSQSGKSIIICDLTYAELSSNGDPETRKKEAGKAAVVLGVKERLNLGLPDRGLRADSDSIAKMVSVIRQYQPKTVLAPYWVDRHPDHGHCSEMVKEAVFSAGIRRYQPRAGEPHKTDGLFYYFINDFVEPDFCIHVTDVYEQKIKSLECYESQFNPAIDRIKTPLNTGYIEQIKSREFLFGRKVGTEFAEGFKSNAPLSLQYFA